MDIQTRRVIAVQVNLPGPTEPELTIDGVRSVARPQGLYLEIELDHVGTALTRGEGTISLPEQGFEQDFVLETFVPRTSIAYPVQWTTDADEGSYPAEVEIRYDGEVATWRGDVHVGDEVLDDLAQREVQPAEHGSDAGLAWLWAVALPVALAVGLGAYLLGRRTASRPAAGNHHADR